MKPRKYYSVRTGKNPQAAKVDLETFRKMFKTIYSGLEQEGYLQEAFGFNCVDSGFLPGELGHDIDGALLLLVRKEGLTPIWQKISEYTEDDLFDVIEVLHDHCSQPTKSQYHSWNDCGLHCEEFDRPAGQAIFRERVNPILEMYGDGFELNHEGEVLSLAESGLEGLLEALIPTDNPENVEARIEAAKRKYRRHRSTLDERRDAIRDLADVLEFLRPKLRKVLTKQDEADLFNIANNFGIRHHNEKQRLEYDRPIFYSWLFYYYLATLHAALRLIRKHEAGPTPG